jgi:putative flippase GtrA
LKEKFSQEAIRFLIAGIINTALTYWIYYISVDLIGYLKAFSIAFVLGIIISYTLNSIFVFKARIKMKTFYRYPIICATQYLLGIFILSILINYFGINNKIAPILNVIFLIPVTFLINKWFFGKE